MGQAMGDKQHWISQADIQEGCNSFWYIAITYNLVHDFLIRLGMAWMDHKQSQVSPCTLQELGRKDRMYSAIAAMRRMKGLEFDFVPRYC